MVQARHVYRAVIDVLKVAEGPLTVREISLRVLASRGEAEPPLKVIRDMEGGVRTTLRNKHGKSVESVGEGIPLRWQLVSTGVE